VETGQGYELFWQLTLREISVILDAEGEKLRRHHNNQMSLAWHIESLARQKKLPRLKTLLIDEEKKPKRRQTPEELEAITRAWLASRHRKKQDGIGRNRRTPSQPRD
jgi:hypothetical protein